MQLLHEGDYGPMQAFFPGGSPLRRLIVPSRVVHPWFPNRARAVAHRILVVDDEPMVRALIARALIDDGFEVVAVANGLAALRQDFPSLPILHVTTSPGGVG